MLRRNFSSIGKQTGLIHTQSLTHTLAKSLTDLADHSAIGVILLIRYVIAA